MKISTTLLLVFLLIGIMGCTNKEVLTTDNPLDLFNKNHKLQGEVIPLDKELLGMPAYRMVKLDSLLIILDWINTDDKFLFIVDLKNNRLLGKIVQVGWGPNEFSLIEGVKVNSAGNKVNFMDPNKKQFFDLDLTRFLENPAKPVAPKLIMTLRDANNNLTAYTDVLQVNDNIFIGFGPQSGEGMFSIIDASGTVIKDLYAFPDNGPGVDNVIAGQIYYGEIHKQPSGNRIACVAQPGLLGILEYAGNDNLTIITQFETLKPSFTLSEKGPIRKRDSKLGYVTSSVSDRYIYVGYDDQPVQQSGASCKYILVFDWDGNPKVLLELDHRIVAFTVDEEEKAIYAVANMPEPKIITYSIEL